MANLGFLSPEENKNIWGLPRQTAFIDSGQATKLVQPEQPSTVQEEQLLSGIVGSSLDPTLKQYADEANQTYQNVWRKYSPYGGKASNLINWYKNQADQYQNEYDTAYGNAMQSAVGDLIRREKPSTYEEALSLLEGKVTDPDDWEAYVKPRLDIMDITPGAYEPGTLFNKKGESQTYQTRAQEIKAREEGFNLKEAPKLKEPETLWNHATGESVVIENRQQEVDARNRGYDQTSPLADPTINPTLATSKMYTAASRKLYRETGDASVLEEKPQEIAKLSPEDKFQQERALRNDFERSTEEFRGLTDAYGRILVGAEDKSGLGDMTIIFNYMKMLDPDSTVREGEYAEAEDTQGLPEWLLLMYEKSVDVLKGKGSRAEVFRDVGRERFVNMTDQLFRQRFATYTRRAEHMTQLAENYGLDVGNIVLEYAPIILDDQGNPEFIQIGARRIPYDLNVLPQALNSGATDPGEELSPEEQKRLEFLENNVEVGGGW